MSALSPYAVEFVQGEAYAGKLASQERNMGDDLSDSLSKVKIGTRRSKPKAGRAYDVSLESMLIETALSRIQQQPLPVVKTEASHKKANPAERVQRKKKFIRPSDANKKLSKLKKSVVDFREEQARLASGGADCDAQIARHSSDEIGADQSSCHVEPTPRIRTQGQRRTDTDSDGSSEETKVEELNPDLSSEDPPAGQSDPLSSTEAQETQVETNSDEQKVEVSASPDLSIDAQTNSRKQPLKRTPTMDRLKADLQGDELKEVEQLATELIIGLKRFQDRLYNKDEVKARMRQRMYYGLKESIKFMQGQKVKMIIMARDLEAGPGGLDELIENLLSKAKIHRVPVVVALSRNKLKRLSQKPSKVACIAITDPSGRDEQFERILEIVKPLGLFENLGRAELQAEAEEQQRKAQQDLANWTSTTRRGRFEFAVDKLFPT